MSVISFTCETASPDEPRSKLAAPVDQVGRQPGNGELALRQLQLSEDEASDLVAATASRSCKANCLKGLQLKGGVSMEGFRASPRRLL